MGVGLKLWADYFLDFKTFGLQMKDFHLWVVTERMNSGLKLMKDCTSHCCCFYSHKERRQNWIPNSLHSSLLLLLWMKWAPWSLKEDEHGKWKQKGTESFSCWGRLFQEISTSWVRRHQPAWASLRAVARRDQQSLTAGPTETAPALNQPRKISRNRLRMSPSKPNYLLTS